MKESGRRRSLRTSTRSDEDIWEAAISEDRHCVCKRKSDDRNDKNGLVIPNRISLKYINWLCGTWLRGKEREAAFPQGFIRVSRYAKQALGPMDGSWRRGSPRTSTSLIEESGTRRSPKTSTRSDEGIREATDLRGQALGLMKESGGRGSPRTNTRSDAGIWEASLSKDKH